jgi:hypothetical protein
VVRLVTTVNIGEVFRNALVMKELSRLFWTYCPDSHSGWSTILPKIELVFNVMPHISTSYSPYEVISGKNPSNPLSDQECYSRQVTFFFRVRICYNYECALLFGILGINYLTLIFVYEITTRSKNASRR